jgi:hypothetical protein
MARPTGRAGGQEFHGRRPQHRSEMAEEERCYKPPNPWKMGEVCCMNEVGSFTEDAVSSVQASLRFLPAHE